MYCRGVLHCDIALPGYDKVLTGVASLCVIYCCVMLRCVVLCVFYVLLLYVVRCVIV